MANEIDLKAMSRKVRKLPTLPGVALKILQAMRRETPSIKEISEIISADAPLSAKVLQVVNSPFYGLANKISSVQQAMVYLGLNTVKNLALSFSLMRNFQQKPKGGFDHVRFWKDSLTGAVAAKLLAEKVCGNNGENAFFLGLLQDIGVLILADSMPEPYGQVLRKASAEGIPLHEAENEILGTNHMEVGEYVTYSWGLPVAFTAPLGAHHVPERLETPLEDVEQLTRVLNLSSLFVELLKGADTPLVCGRIDRAFRTFNLRPSIEKLEIAEKITENIRDIFPIFEMEIDEAKYIEIIDTARGELAQLSDDLLDQVRNQTQDLNRLKLQVGLDGLTQLDNHKRFVENLQSEISRASRYKTALSLIMADVDHFKSINDFFGHLAGDHALKCVSARLRQELRDSDLIARYGGEEFAMILPMTTLTEGCAAAERLRKAVADTKIEYKGKPVSVTMSFGVAALGSQTVDVEGFIKMADEALYEAKRTGRNRCCRFMPSEPERSLAPTVVVIDDEEVVLVTVTKMLQRLGYSVLAAKSGQEAIKLFHSRPRVDMVIMDMVMPDVAPEQLLKSIRGIGSDVKVVLSSGYCPTTVGNSDLFRKTDGFLQKPYQLSELSKIVTTTLNSSSPQMLPA